MYYRLKWLDTDTGGNHAGENIKTNPYTWKKKLESGLYPEFDG